MFQTKVTRRDWQTPEQYAAGVRQWRRDDAQKRRFNNMMGFWRTCEKPLCRRKHSCADDMHACYQAKWRATPEPVKEYVRGMILASKDTRSSEAIRGGGLARLESYLKTKERMETMDAANAAPVAPVREAPPEPTARVRRL